MGVSNSCNLESMSTAQEIAPIGKNTYRWEVCGEAERKGTAISCRLPGITGQGLHRVRAASSIERWALSPYDMFSSG